ncbi:MAG: chemotaxis protein CheW [Cyanobacteria bacterium J06634_5]
MLVLLFHIGEARWALEAAEIQDILSLVDLQMLPGGTSAASLGGDRANSPSLNCRLLNYHGDLIPVVDVGQAVAGEPAPELLSTRIAIVLQPRPAGAPLRLGLILDRASETIDLSEKVPVPLSRRYVRSLMRLQNFYRGSSSTSAVLSGHSEVLSTRETALDTAFPLLDISSFFTAVESGFVRDQRLSLEPLAPNEDRTLWSVS